MSAQSITRNLPLPKALQERYGKRLRVFPARLRQSLEQNILSDWERIGQAGYSEDDFQRDWERALDAQHLNYLQQLYRDGDIFQHIALYFRMNAWNFLLLVLIFVSAVLAIVSVHDWVDKSASPEFISLMVLQRSFVWNFLSNLVFFAPFMLLWSVALYVRALNPYLVSFGRLTLAAVPGLKYMRVWVLICLLGLVLSAVSWGFHTLLEPRISAGISDSMSEQVSWYCRTYGLEWINPYNYCRDPCNIRLTVRDTPISAQRRDVEGHILSYYVKPWAPYFLLPVLGVFWGKRGRTLTNKHYDLSLSFSFLACLFIYWQMTVIQQSLLVRAEWAEELFLYNLLLYNLNVLLLLVFVFLWFVFAFLPLGQTKGEGKLDVLFGEP